MNVRKTDDFIADIERQYEWYAVNAGWDVADRYLATVETTCRLLRELKRVDFKPRGIVAAVDKIIEEVPIEGARVKTDLVKAFLEDRE